jgi:autotransporter-associated beta strand protein
LDLDGAGATVGGLNVFVNSTATNTISIGAGNTLQVNGSVLIGPNTNANTTTRIALTGAGTFGVSGANASFTIGGSTNSSLGNAATLDMSGLSTFVADLGAGTFRVGDARNDGGSGTGSSTLILASNSTITAAILTSASPTPGPQVIRLGAVSNAFNANTIYIGQASDGYTRANGILTFHTSSGTLTIRDTNGTGRADMIVGYGTSGTGFGPAVDVDLLGHSVDLLLGSLQVGGRTGTSGGGPTTANFKLDSGTLDANGIVVGDRAGTSGNTGLVRATLDLGGGTVAIGDSGLIVGRNTSTLTANSVTGVVNVSGGTVLTVGATNGTSITLGSSATAGVTAHAVLNIDGNSAVIVDGDIRKGAGSGVASVTSTLNLNGAGATLDMRANDITDLTSFVFQDGTLKDVGSVNSPITLAGSGQRLFLQDSNGVISGAIGGTNAGLFKAGAGTLTLGGANAYTGATTVAGGVLRLDGASALPGGTGATGGTGALLLTNGGALGLGAGDFYRDLGAGPSNVSWSGSGGFSAYGGTRAVNIGGATQALTWGQASFVSNGQELVLATADATGTIDFQNPIDLVGSDRFGAEDGLQAVDARLSGNLGGSGSFLKTGDGVIELTGSNTYSGGTELQAGGLLLGGANALSENSLLTISNFSVVRLGAGDFARPLGTGAGEVRWTGSGGFAAVGADRLVNLGGATGWVAWGSNSFVPEAVDGGVLVLGSADATGTLDFQNHIDLGASNRTVQVNDGAAALDAKLSGTIAGTGGLVKTGLGTLVLSASNTYDGGTTVIGGTLALAGGGHITGGDLLVGINATTGTFVGQAGATLSVGSGSSSRLLVGVNMGASPGASVGTLDIGSLSDFSANVGSFMLGQAGSAGSASAMGTVILATNNTIAASTIFAVGSDSLSSGNSMWSSLQFGAGSNLVATPQMLIGGRKTYGAVTIAPGGTLALTNSATGGRTDVYVGDNDTGTGTTANGDLDISDGTFIASIGEWVIGRKTGGGAGGGVGNAIGTATLGTSASNRIDVNSITIGSRNDTTGTGSPTATGTLTFNGGQMLVNSDVNIGTFAGTAGLVSGTFTINGGAVTVGGHIFGSTSNQSTSTLNLNGGTLDMTDGDIAEVKQFNFSGGILKDVGTVSSPVVLTNAGERTFQQDGSGAGEVSGVISGTAGLAKTGTGTLLLSGTNTYTGTTLVEEGRLVVNGTLASALTSVKLGATLGGDGAILGGPTVFESGSTNDPGLSPGIQTFSGLTYSNGAILRWELAANTNDALARGSLYDGVNVTNGELNIVGGATLQLVFDGTGSQVDWTNEFWSVNREWQLIELQAGATTNALSSLFMTNFALGGDFQDMNGRQLDTVWGTAEFITFYQADGVYLQYLVPEPGAWFALLAGIGAAACLRRRGR